MCLFRTPTQDRNVSPIDDYPDMSRLDIGAEHGGPGQQSTPEPQQKTNIPMMRRERRKNQEAAAHTLRETKSQQRLRIQRETRWDDMTGEPTSQNTGRAGQVRPQEYAQEFGANEPFGKSPAAMRAMQNAPQTHQTFGDRLRRLRPSGGNQKQQQPPPESATAAEAIDERPPWRGASGRAPIVNPVRDTKPAAPLSIPPRARDAPPLDLGCPSRVSIHHCPLSAPRDLKRHRAQRRPPSELCSTLPDS
ncbi:hypothetical protein Ct61P_01644 [Colletotrichum tofieldiae]|nr:hypothetical protein Ct61P_01644 [Colletotrichum tofieldiae]